MNMKEKSGFFAGVLRYLNHIFIDGLSGMALGLFATLIVGTILAQIAALIPGQIGYFVGAAASLAKALTGAGIGVGIAAKYKRAPLVTVSCAVAGLVGAFSAKIIAGTVLTDGNVLLAGPGEPLGAFLAAFTAAEIGALVSGKTKLDILLTPVCCIASGSAVGLLIGTPISNMMTALGSLINWGTVQQPVLMGIVVSAVMGMALTLPISSAAIGVILGLSGTAAGAACIGCCAQMIGFAVISFRENKVGGLVSQGLGTSMLQMGNIVKNPRVWIAPTLASAITGPIATCVFKMEMNGSPISSGMGTCGLVGPLGVYTGWLNDVASGAKAGITATDWLGLILICFVLPAVLSLVIHFFVRKAGWVKDGDLKI